MWGLNPIINPLFESLKMVCVSDWTLTYHPHSSKPGGSLDLISHLPDTNTEFHSHFNVYEIAFKWYLANWSKNDWRKQKGKPENALLFPSERGSFIPPWRIKPKERGHWLPCRHLIRCQFIPPYENLSLHCTFVHFIRHSIHLMVYSDQIGRHGHH